MTAKTLTSEERVVLDALAVRDNHQVLKRKQTNKKYVTNLRAKERFGDLNRALDLLIDGPTKQHYEDYGGQHALFDA